MSTASKYTLSFYFLVIELVLNGLLYCKVESYSELTLIFFFDYAAKAYT